MLWSLLKVNQCLEEHVAPSSGSQNKPRKKLILWPWRWRLHVPAKCQLTFSVLHVIISQNICICNHHCENLRSHMFKFVIHDHVSDYLNFKLNSCQHFFTKSKFTITTLKINREFITPLIRSQHQADTFYFVCISALSHVPHTLLLKLLEFLVVNWFCSYLTNQILGPCFWNFLISFWNAVQCFSRVCSVVSVFQCVFNDICHHHHHHQFLLLHFGA
jgi:hypothetical protein